MRRSRPAPSGWCSSPVPPSARSRITSIPTRSSSNCSNRRARASWREQVRSVLPSYASCIYIRQPAPLGLGHAVLCARPAVGDEPFFVHLADDLIDAEVPCLKQMAATYRRQRGAACSGSRKCRDSDTDKYGIVEVETGDGAGQPHQEHRREAQARGGPLDPGGGGPLRADAERFSMSSSSVGQGAGGEIQLTDGIARLLQARGRLCAPLHRPALRLRQQARLPAGDGRAVAGASGRWARTFAPTSSGIAATLDD